jgi:hypothetical protein
MCQRRGGGGAGGRKKFDDLFSEGDEMSTKKFCHDLFLFTAINQSSPPVHIRSSRRPSKQGGGRAPIDVLPVV